VQGKNFRFPEAQAGLDYSLQDFRILPICTGNQVFQLYLLTKAAPAYFERIRNGFFHL